jgi:hypothetical protein
MDIIFDGGTEQFRLYGLGDFYFFEITVLVLLGTYPLSELDEVVEVPDGVDIVKLTLTLECTTPV